VIPLPRRVGRVYSWRAMGSPWSLHLPDLPEGEGERLAAAVAADVEASEQALSRFRPEAELVRLNARLGRETVVSPRLYAALSAAWRAHRATGGLFDPRVLRTLEAYGYAGAPRPEDADLPGPWLERHPRRRAVTVRAPLDLGGIGKGLAVRWAARRIERFTANYLLNGGGDLVLDGAGPQGEGWQIGVEDPRDGDALVAALRLRGRTAVCTSSIARHRWEHAGRRVHHLIDPRTGEAAASGLLAVTVVARDPAWAEVWSKSLFVAGGATIARAAAGQAVLWVDRDGRLGATAAAERLLFWRAPAAT
jgi:thiamine biosynthesis lipoprotein